MALGLRARLTVSPQIYIPDRMHPGLTVRQT